MVVIPKGEGVRAIASAWSAKASSPTSASSSPASIYFRAQSRLKAGEYAIKKHASMSEVLDTLVEGKEILYSVSDSGGADQLSGGRAPQGHPELTGQINLVPSEGSLLPDTYRFAAGPIARS